MITGKELVEVAQQLEHQTKSEGVDVGDWFKRKGVSPDGAALLGKVLSGTGMHLIGEGESPQIAVEAVILYAFQVGLVIADRASEEADREVGGNGG
jgi:hypothetical protein